MGEEHPILGDVPENNLVQKILSSGLCIDYGACSVRLKTNVATFATQLGIVYRNFPLQTDAEFSDFHVIIKRGSFLRRLLWPTAHFLIDGIQPFEPFPTSDALPLYEWGVNWSLAQRFNQYVLLHAGVLALSNRAIIMPATPGSGKSTLAAALMLRGFRLLSDEFGVLDPDLGSLVPMIKPVALKNRSIDIIRNFSDEPVLGPTFKATRKGDVAHLGPDSNSVSSVHQHATPRLIVFPQYCEGSSLIVKPQPAHMAFSRLAFNSFNYALLGPISFNAIANMASTCSAYELRYSRLEEAIDCIEDILLETSTTPQSE